MGGCKVSIQIHVYLPLFQPRVFTISGIFWSNSRYLEKHCSIQDKYLVGSSDGVTPPKKQELKNKNNNNKLKTLPIKHVNIHVLSYR
jgi:hypothetical protein